MRPSHLFYFLLTVILFGLTLAFAIAGWVTAMYDISHGIYIWENDVAYPVLAFSLGGLCLLICRVLLPSSEPQLQLVTLDELLQQD